ncbi:diacylglycerol/lipid kinase family protein [Demequina oxidasica]|uniref:diacylglycerol/lipid kinase family protein n=1 Tax=Demequina oxidasica TaxID=676199 RepID=UPI000780C57F|nr:diacylglycerol kinase family protein [Demequina oxidasica]
MLAIVLSSVALFVGLLALVIGVTTTRHIGRRDPVAVPNIWRKLLRIKSRRGHELGRVGAASGRRERIAFIANPTKDGISELRELSMRACSIRYMPEPLWYFTTVEDPGEGQAREAIESGADVVVAVGGDGTVRAVAAAVAGTDTAMGILPMGTGNLFARNLELPLGDSPALLRAILDGEETAIDVVWLHVERAHRGHTDRDKHICLVIAGAGFDAEMVAGADDKMKRKLGWFAYFLAAIRHVGEKRMEASVSVDGSPAVTSHMRTVLVANVGSLPGGIRLIPDASVTDGTLDVATLDARAGVVGWTDLFGTVMAQGAGLKQPDAMKAWRTSRIDHVRGKSVEIQMKHPQKIQVDGETLGRATGIHAEVARGALKMRVPMGDKVSDGAGDAVLADTEDVNAAAIASADAVLATDPGVPLPAVPAPEEAATSAAKDD